MNLTRTELKMIHTAVMGRYYTLEESYRARRMLEDEIQKKLTIIRLKKIINKLEKELLSRSRKGKQAAS